MYRVAKTIANIVTVKRQRNTCHIFINAHKIVAKKCLALLQNMNPYTHPYYQYNNAAVYPPYPPYPQYPQYMGPVNNQYEAFRMCQERVEAHVHKLEQLLESIKKDKNLIQSTNKDKNIEDNMLMDLFRHQQAKQEMESTNKKLSQLKDLINANWHRLDSEEPRFPLEESVAGAGGDAGGDAALDMPPAMHD